MNCECPQDVIIITQGDDSNAIDGNIVLELDTDLDLKGWTARFQIGEQVWDFDDITSKELNLVITKEQSAQMPVGDNWGALKIYDASGLAKTVIRNIKVIVRAEVVSNGN